MSFGEKGLDKNFCIKSKLKISISYISSMSCLCVCPLFFISTYLSVHVRPQNCLSICLSIYLSICLIICVISHIYLFLSVCLSAKPCCCERAWGG